MHWMLLSINRKKMHRKGRIFPMPENRCKDLCNTIFLGCVSNEMILLGFYSLKKKYYMSSYITITTRCWFSGVLNCHDCQ